MNKTKRIFGIRKRNYPSKINKLIFNNFGQKRTLDVFISPLCLTCIERIIEIKHLQEVFSTLRIKVMFYCEGSKEEARTLKTDFRLPYRVISIDNKSRIWINSNVSVTPFYSLKNNKGKVIISGRFNENWAQTKSLLLEEFKIKKERN